MAGSSPCPYCLRLPERKRDHAHSVRRCPLCKTEHGIARSGDRFRIPADVPTAPARGTNRWFATAVAVPLVAAAVIAAWPKTPPAHTTIPGDQMPPTEAVVIVATETYAESKPRGDELPSARAKPAVPPVQLDKLLAFERLKAAPIRLAALKPADENAKVRAKPSAARLPRAVLIANSKGSRPEPNWLFGGYARSLSPDTALRSAPEVRMASAATRDEVAALAATIRREHQDGLDRFVKDRPDLRGLPFLKGTACRLDAEAAEALALASRGIRQSLSTIEKSLGKSALDNQIPPSTALWQVASFQLGSSIPARSRYSPGYLDERTQLAILPAMLQITAVEAPAHRLATVGQLSWSRSEVATAALVRLAIFDPDVTVRQTALDVLENSEAGHRREALESSACRDTILGAFRYPWPEIAFRAADLVIRLRCANLAPALVDFLDERDPAAPFEKNLDGRQVPHVRELARINHHRNCLLCHAAHGSERLARNEPFGLVPSADEPLPPASSLAYYSAARGSTVVLASVTYLRQDFSLMQEIENPGQWPKQQRFDFLVRTREVTPEEAAKRYALLEERPAGEPCPNHQAALQALRDLTGTYLGPRASDWREHLRAAREGSR